MTDHPKSDACILIAEITGDAPLLGKLGAMETQRAVERSRNRAERSIDACEGQTLEAQGRTLIALFARSESAAQAAFDLRDRVRQLPPVSGVMLSVRASIHYGRLEASGQHPVDAAMSRTRQLVSASAAGQILISKEAADTMPALLREHLEAAELDGQGEVFVFRGNTLPQLSKQGSEAGAVTPVAATETAPRASEDVAPPANQAAATRSSMMLRHNKNMLSVSDNRPVILAGREEGNDLVIADRRASRHHARIEWRQGRYILIDTSTNGTFMTDEAGNETALRRAETELPARGRIGFGYSPMEAGAEVIFFDIGQR